MCVGTACVSAWRNKTRHNHYGDGEGEKNGCVERHGRRDEPENCFTKKSLNKKPDCPFNDAKVLCSTCFALLISRKRKKTPFSRKFSFKSFPSLTEKFVISLICGITLVYARQFIVMQQIFGRAFLFEIKQGRYAGLVYESWNIHALSLKEGSASFWFNSRDTVSPRSARICLSLILLYVTDTPLPPCIIWLRLFTNQI